MYVLGYAFLMGPYEKVCIPLLLNLMVLTTDLSNPSFAWKAFFSRGVAATYRRKASLLLIMFALGLSIILFNSVAVVATL